LPKAIVLIGALAGVFVRVATDKQNTFDAVISVGAITAWFYLICYLSLFIIRADTRIWMSWFWPNTILFNKNSWCSLALEHYFYKSLVWQVSAGVPYSRAIERCRSLLSSDSFSVAVNKASKDMAKGCSLSQSLIKHGLVLTDRMRQVLLVADESGTHEAAIKHELKLQSGRLDLKAKNFFKWAPRFFYLVALIVVSKLMSFY